MSEVDIVTLRRGSLYLARDVYERHFAGLDAIILLRRDADLLILPVRNTAAGGYVLKRRNGAGDRVVTAPDFFRAHGIDDDGERNLSVLWSEAEAGLRAQGLFGLQT